MSSNPVHERPRWGQEAPSVPGAWLYLRAYAGGLAPKRALFVTGIRDGVVLAIPLARGTQVAERILPDRWTHWAGPFPDEASALEALADERFVPTWA